MQEQPKEHIPFVPAFSTSFRRGRPLRRRCHRVSHTRSCAVLPCTDIPTWKPGSPTAHVEDHQCHLRFVSFPPTSAMQPHFATIQHKPVPQTTALPPFGDTNQVQALRAPHVSPGNATVHHRWCDTCQQIPAKSSSHAYHGQRSGVDQDPHVSSQDSCQLRHQVQATPSSQHLTWKVQK